MKLRLLPLLLLAALILCGCGGEAAPVTTPPATTIPVTTAPAEVNMESVYQSMASSLPEMVMMDEMMSLNLCGIRKEDCAQMVVAKCADGLRADEIWLLEAVDDAAMDRLEQLTKNRLEALKTQTQSYSPEQYAVVQKAQVIRSGKYLAFIVAPNAQELAELFPA